MANASEEVRRWEVINADAPDEYIMYAAGVDDRDSETTCYYDEESAI